MEKLKGSNSTLTLLSRVRDLTEIRFFTKEGDTRMLESRRRDLEVVMVVDARLVTSKVAPIPTVIGAE